MNIEAKLALDTFRVDDEAHIVIDQQICARACTTRSCLFVCPADLYCLDGEARITVNWEGCLECGTCMISCEPGALSWQYPRSGFGVQYRAT
jgi:ferredoxin like protein